MQVGDLVLLSGCCAADGTFLNVWLPNLPASVERVEVHSTGGVWMQEGGNASSAAGVAA
jgi:hypothetical protein